MAGLLPRPAAGPAGAGGRPAPPAVRARPCGGHPAHAGGRVRLLRGRAQAAEGGGRRPGQGGIPGPGQPPAPARGHRPRARRRGRESSPSCWRSSSTARSSAMGVSTFRVEGMSCASCVRRVEKALAAVPGVEAVRVNLATEEAAVEGQGFQEADLAGALAARGYLLVAEPSPETHRDQVRRAGLRAGAAWVLTLPLMAGMLPGTHLHLPWPVQAALAALAAFGAGSGFFLRAARQAWARETSMDTLIALGAAVTWAFGLHEGLQGRAHLPFEAAAGLVAFLLTGKWLEAKARHRAAGQPGGAAAPGPGHGPAPGPGRRRRTGAHPAPAPGGPGAGEARVGGAGGRGGGLGPGGRGGGPAHRGAPPGGQGPRRPADRRGPGARRRAGTAGRGHRPGHLAGPPGPAGGPGPDLPGSGAGLGGPRLGGVRAGDPGAGAGDPGGVVVDTPAPWPPPGARR